MIINIEFLGDEPIENVITCMHHKIDKVIFFGYQEMIRLQKTRTDHYLKTFCGVQEVVYQELSENNLQLVLDTMRQSIELELSRGNKIYFDVTGGEDLILVAFGILSKEYQAPIHQYDIVKNKIMEFALGSYTYLSVDVPLQKAEWNIDRFIELQGGIINYSRHKSVKDLSDPEFAEDVSALWRIACKYKNQWNPFSGFMREHLIPDENLQVRENAKTIISALWNTAGKLNRVEDLNHILDDLKDAGLLLDLVHRDGRYAFKIKNQLIKECLWESGSILELQVYQNEKKHSDDCRVGVHLDWDGVIMPQGEGDVINEIDVLSLTGNIPTFISCKSGINGSQKILHALYELETVTRRFGGKYARMILATTNSLGSVYQQRAKEMNIEVYEVGRECN